MSVRAILAALSDGPKSNRELQDAICDYSGGVARTCAKLIHDGRVKRVDDRRGRGTRAIYGLAPKAKPHTCFTVSTTAYLRNLDNEDRRAETYAVHYQKPPEDLGDGRRSIGMIFPTLIVSAYMAEPEKIAQRVADILNKHWDDEQ